MVLDLLFPIKCYQCNKPGSYLCQECLTKIPLIRKQICPRCGQPSPNGAIHPNCQNRLTKFSGVFSIYPYSSLVGQLVRDYKYEFVFKLEDNLIDLTVRGLERSQKLLSFWRKKKYTFMPVPLFIAKKIFRGYDQADKLINGAAERLNLTYSNEILFRQKWTSQQSKLSKKKRQKNVSNAFGINDKSAVKGKNFVLFDDVYTTGSTLRSAAAALKSAAAGQIWGLTLCR